MECLDYPLTLPPTVLTLAREVIAACRQARVRVAVAESCTGGWVGAALTAVPGASGAFNGGAMCYQNRLKATLLGVCWETLEGAGAVSAECARQMAEGVCRLTESCLGLAVTGVAGPGGESEKPAGLVYTAVSLKGETVVAENHFSGGRAEVRAQSVEKVLQMALECLRKRETT